jgi:hypothetical protein
VREKLAKARQGLFVSSISPIGAGAIPMTHYTPPPAKTQQQTPPPPATQKADSDGDHDGSGGGVNILA